MFVLNRKMVFFELSRLGESSSLLGSPDPEKVEPEAIGLVSRSAGRDSETRDSDVDSDGSDFVGEKRSFQRQFGRR